MSVFTDYPGFSSLQQPTVEQKQASLHNPETGRTYFPSLGLSGETLDFCPLQTRFNQHKSWNVWKVNGKGEQICHLGQIWWDKDEFKFYAFHQEEISFIIERYINAFKRNENAIRAN